MKTGTRIYNVTLCGPSDVAREVALAQEVITDWNLKHSDALGVYVRQQHWLTDATPDLADRPQGVINRQMIDDADIIVAIFWSRLGTPTGVTRSETEEEIRRGLVLNKRVMVYFSDLEPLPHGTDSSQLTQLDEFRRDLQQKGLCWGYASRRDFHSSFERHLARAIHDLNSRNVRPSSSATSQSIVGNNNIQVAGPVNVYETSPTVKHVVERRHDSVNRSQEKQIQKWIEDLAEGTLDKNRRAAFSEWWTRFKKRFGVTRYEELPAERMPEVQTWYKQQKAMQSRGLKGKAPDAWRNDRIRAIKASMRSMGETNETYYPEVARLLRMKKPFTSLKDLTKRDLERVYNMAIRDDRAQ